MEQPYIPRDNCKKGFLYRIHSRNLRYGVYNGKDGFIGIRTKFSDRYLFTEEHWDQGPPYGTVRPLEEICELPNTVPVYDYGPARDEITGRPVDFDGPKVSGGRGWVFTDTNEPSADIRPMSRHNDILFDWLNKYEKQAEEIERTQAEEVKPAVQGGTGVGTPGTDTH